MIRKMIFAAALLALGAGTAANADVLWTVNGTFNDTGTLSGTFDIDVYGFLNGYNLMTTAGTSLPGFDYTPADSFFSNGTFYVDAQPGYQQDLHLAFLDDLSVATGDDPIVGGDPGPSWECVNSWSCYVPSGGDTRYIASGFASAGDPVPEPSSLPVLLAGLGLIGCALSFGRKKMLA
jgi:PEP-CTERM motif